jgi:hypothetical protein
MAASSRVTILVNDMLRDHPQAAREALEGTRTVKEALERSGIFAAEGMTDALVTETRGVIDRFTDEQNHRVLHTVREALDAGERVHVKWEGLVWEVIDVDVSRDTGGVHLVVRGTAGG